MHKHSGPCCMYIKSVLLLPSFHQQACRSHRMYFYTVWNCITLYMTLGEFVECIMHSWLWDPGVWCMFKYVCFNIHFSKSGGLNQHALCHQHCFKFMHSYPFTPGWCNTNNYSGAVGGAVPCLRAPQCWLFREGGAFNNFNPAIFLLYPGVLHQHVIVHRCGCDSALFLANCHNMTLWSFHIVIKPRRGMQPQSMTKYFSRADGQDFVSTHGKMEEYLDTGLWAPSKFIATFWPTGCCWVALQRL